MSGHEPLPGIPPNAPKRGTRWRHIRTGDHYGILGVGYHEADLEIVVIYTRAQTIWVRPLTLFLERFRPDPVPICGSKADRAPPFREGKDDVSEKDKARLLGVLFGVATLAGAFLAAAWLISHV